MSADPSDVLLRLRTALGSTYTIDRELGGGGMSRVFAATDPALGRQVVIKVLPPELAHELSMERFAREIRLSSQLQHPNIVPVLTAGEADGMPYYTMPFVDGESLRARLARLAPGERLPTQTAMAVLRDVARALAYAHDRGIIHRDIKPDNVLLGYDAAVVADFGVAKATAAARAERGGAADPTLTRGGSPGTPAYMSPEQVAGDPSLDARTDSYAWGLLAYELLAGAHPFADRTTLQAMVTAHLAETPRDLGSITSTIPASLAATVMRCLAKSPDDRPANGREITEALAGTVSERGAANGASRAQPRMWLLAALGVVLVAGGWGVAAFRRASSKVVDAPTAILTPAAAYDAYLRGKVQVSNENRADNDAAIVTLRAAIAADPQLAAAHATLARAYAIKAFYFVSDSTRKRLNEDAEVEVAKALSLDPNLAEAHFARGLLLWTPSRRFPHEEAVRAYRQALALDSTLDEAHHQIAIVYFHVGLLDEAQKEIDRALAINPGNTLARFRYGVIEMYRGDYERAYAVFNSTPLERNPSLWAFQTATALFRLGRVDEAMALNDRFLRDFPRDEGGVGHSVRAMMFAHAGRRAEADTAAKEALRLGRDFGHFHHAAYNLASASAMLGDRDEALQLLRIAAEDGFPNYPLFAADRQFDGLRADRRFGTLLASLKREYEERKRGMP